MPTFDGSSSGVYDSVPPPRKPALAKCSPERYSLGVAQAQYFRQWCRDHNVSVRDLMTLLGVSYGVAQAKLSGESPITEIDLGMFPERYESDLRIGFAVVSRTHRAEVRLRAHG